MNRLCMICARGGSKGVPGKNIRTIAGIPLIAHSIIQAKETELFDDIAISSDSIEILEVGKKYGATILIHREDELATDTSPKVPVMRDCLLKSELKSGIVYQTIVDLDATSPLRLLDDIIGATKLLESTNAPNVLTGAIARKSPYFNLVELNSNGEVELSKKLNGPIFRRQDAPKCFDLNASIYPWKRDTLLKTDTVYNPGTLLFQMPEDRSIDIDTELDFEMVDLIFKKRGNLYGKFS